jgi:hypothetical protein
LPVFTRICPHKQTGGQADEPAASLKAVVEKTIPFMEGITPLWQRGAGEILQNVSIQFRER